MCASQVGAFFADVQDGDTLLSVAERQGKRTFETALEHPGGVEQKSDSQYTLERQRHRRDAIGCTFTHEVTRLAKRKKLRRPWKLSHKYHYNSAWIHKTQSSGDRHQHSTESSDDDEMDGGQLQEEIRTTTHPGVMVLGFIILCIFMLFMVGK